MKTFRFGMIPLAAAFVAGLAGCGGGGGGGGPPPVVPTIDISAPNRDSVAHAAAASILAMNPSGAIPLGASASASAQLSRALQQRLDASAPNSSAGRKTALALIGPTPTQCAFGGWLTETHDDRDGNLVPSVGDIFTFVYDNCRETAGETLNGTMTMTLTQVSVSPVPSGTAQVVLTQMSMATVNHSMTANGSTRVDVTFPNFPNVSTLTARITADGPVTVALSIAHLGYSDTLTLQSGFFEEDSYDATLARTVSTVSGHLHSANAGGIVEVSTLAGAPITKLDSDLYPSAGVLQAKGRNSTLRVTALSAAAARLDLDADGNGSFEATETKSWDWLL